MWKITVTRQKQLSCLQPHCMGRALRPEAGCMCCNFRVQLCAAGPLENRPMKNVHLVCIIWNVHCEFSNTAMVKVSSANCTKVTLCKAAVRVLSVSCHCWKPETGLAAGDSVCPHVFKPRWLPYVCWSSSLCRLAFFSSCWRRGANIFWSKKQNAQPLCPLLAKKPVTQLLADFMISFSTVAVTSLVIFIYTYIW